MSEHTCDQCGGTFAEEDMHALGGDRFVDGFAPEAFPSECVDCFLARFAARGAR